MRNEMDELFRKKLLEEYGKSHKAKYIRELTKIVLDSQPDYVVTLTFAYTNVSEWNARSKLSTWLKWVNQAIYGRRSKKRLTIFPFRESNSLYGLHYHIMVEDPNIKNKDIRDIFKEKWLRLSGTGHSSFRDRDPITGELNWFKVIWDHSNLTKYLNKQAIEQRMNSLEIECTNYYE